MTLATHLGVRQPISKVDVDLINSDWHLGIMSGSIQLGVSQRKESSSSALLPALARVCVRSVFGAAGSLLSAPSCCPTLQSNERRGGEREE